jgi:hypothetical protein|tara:strand:+ start:546 stop:965 length:420 start_codon:yes stop_codon:yes gene_type:complete
MIKYNLICKCGNTFESWFSASSEFDSLLKKKVIKCIYCESSDVKKTVMAPRLSRKSNQILKKNKLQRNIKKQLVDFKKYIEKNCEDVGERFPQEARNIHYDKKTSKGIYGKATSEETSELIEEGIDVCTLPWLDDKLEN